MKKVLAVCGLALVIVAFQNCAKTSFSNSSGDSMDAKGSLTAIPLDASDVPPPDGSASGQISQSSEMPPVMDDKKKSPPAMDHDSDSISNDDSSDDVDLVACILVDHGKSLKLGFVADKLEGVNAVAESVCISRHACLDIVSKAFPVEGAYERGYCEHNPNVLRLKDAEVEALIKKLMP